MSAAAQAVLHIDGLARGVRCEQQRNKALATAAMSNGQLERRAAVLVPQRNYSGGARRGAQLLDDAGMASLGRPVQRRVAIVSLQLLPSAAR